MVIPETRLIAEFASLPGKEVPAGFQEVWEKAGFSCRRLNPEQPMQSLPVETDLCLLWVGCSWEEANRWLIDQTPEDLRVRTVLVGFGMDASHLAKAHAAGGFAAVEWPLADWVGPTLARAVERSQKPIERLLTRALSDLRQEFEQPPESVLVRVAELAERTLGCERAFVALEQQGPEKLLALARSPDGVVPRDLGEEDKLLSELAQKLSLTFQLSGVPLTVPDLDADWVGLPGKKGVPWQSAVLVPLRSSDVQGAEWPKPLSAALHLYWKEPWLPNMVERLILGTLAIFAAASLTQLAGRTYETMRQAVSRNLLIGRDTTAESLDEKFLDSEETLVRNNSLEEIAKTLLTMFFGGRLGLRELWTRVSLSTCGSSDWLVVGPKEHESGPPVMIPPSHEKTILVPVPESNSDWVVLSLLKERASSLGQLVAIFSSRIAAAAARDEVELLADDLYRAVRKVRQGMNSKALSGLSTAPASLTEAKTGLQKIAEVVRNCLDADGAKIYVLRRAPEGAVIWQICNTQMPDQESQRVPFSPDRGLADWVLREKKWLFIPEVNDVDRTMTVPQHGITEGGRRIEVLARPGKEQHPNATDPDNETSILLVPFSGEEKVAGVLSVWREQGKPFFDTELDLESLLRFAPHVAAACQRLLQLEKAETQLAEMAWLGRTLAESQSLREGYGAIAAGTGKLADAACAVLLHHDIDESGCTRLYPSAIWNTTKREGGGAPLFLRLSSIPCNSNVEEWGELVFKHFSEALAPLVFRSLLTPPIVKEERPSPPLAVALLDRQRQGQEPDFFSDELIGHFALSFLQSATALLEGHVPNFASRLIDQLDGPPSLDRGEREDDPGRPEEILKEAAKLLQQATGADAALAYSGTPRHMKVQAAWPANDRTTDLEILPGSLTAESLRRRAPIRVLDAREGEPLHRRGLEKITEAFGWKEVRSWLCCPVVHENRVIGLIKLLTQESGVFLGENEQKIAELLAKQASWEMLKASRRLILEDLLKLMDNKIASLRGTSLGEAITSQLRGWAGRLLMRPGCRVVVIARVEGGSFLVKTAYPSLQEKDLDALAGLSLHSKGQLIRWSAKSSSGDTPGSAVRAINPAGIGQPIVLPGVTRLTGHLFVLDRDSFNAEEPESVKEAARLVAVLLNAELVRNELKQTLGRFRHAALGPIQGVKSVAEVLALLAKDAGANPEEVKKYQAWLAKEVEELSLWRENQRFYQNEKVEIRPRRQALRPLVERCFKRFRSIFEEQKIHYRLDWQPKGEVHLDFDDHALDLVLSNLLDNARKYVFRDQKVEVGARIAVETIQIWVEDIGHGIDDSLRDKVFQVGERAVGFDPFRTIAGEGLGLPMARAIVMAHGGELDYTSYLYTTGRTPETTPHRVRFTIDLPLAWRRAK